MRGGKPVCGDFQDDLRCHDALLEDPRLPGWALWLAQDPDGGFWVFEAEPNEGDYGWYENEVGRYRRVGQGEPPGDWRRALWKLPRRACD